MFAACHIFGEHIARSNIGFFVILQHRAVEHDKTPRQMQAGAGHIGQDCHAPHLQPFGEPRQRGTAAGAFAGGAGHPFKPLQQRRAQGDALDLGDHFDRVIAQRAGHPKDRQRRHHGDRGDHAHPPQAARLRAAAVNGAAQLFDGLNHLGFIVGQFQRLSRIAVRMIERGGLAGIGPVDGSQRPMGQRLIFEIADHQCRITDRDDHLAPLRIGRGAPKARRFEPGVFCQGGHGVLLRACQFSPLYHALRDQQWQVT